MTIPDYKPNGSEEDFRLISAGHRLADSEVKVLKSKLKSDPNDLRTRLLLLGSAWRKKPKTISYLNNVVWLIENSPRHPSHDLISSSVPESRFDTIRRHWLSQVRLNPQDPAVLFNAGKVIGEAFFGDWVLSDKRGKEGAKLLVRAAVLDPSNEEIALSLSNVFRRMAYHCSSRKDRSRARKAIEYGKQAVGLYARPNDKHSYLLQYFAMVVSDLGDLAIQFELAPEAEDLGHILLKHKKLDSKRLPPSSISNHPSAYRVATNNGYSLLGRAALLSGDTETAKKYLAKMMQVEVDWFSDWQLANRLLELGETEVVSRYIEHCRKAWEQTIKDFDAGLPNRTGYLPGNKEHAINWETKLSNWLKQIKAGRTPNLDPRC